MTLLMSFIMGPLLEEAGWSGFALPRLQSKFTPFKASLILGILWAIWHLPLWFIPGTAQSTMSFPMFFIILIALRFIMAWAYNNTNGSLLIAVIFHGFFNFGNAIGVGILKVPMNSFLYIAGTVLIIYSAIILIKTKNLSIGKKVTI